MEDKLKDICKKIDGINPSKVKRFIVMDEIVYGEVSMSYLNKDGISCMYPLFVAHPFNHAVKCASQLAEKYGAELIV